MSKSSFSQLTRRCSQERWKYQSSRPHLCSMPPCKLIVCLPVSTITKIYPLYGFRPRTHGPHVYSVVGYRRIGPVSSPPQCYLTPMTCARGSTGNYLLVIVKCIYTFYHNAYTIIIITIKCTRGDDARILFIVLKVK